VKVIRLVYQLKKVIDLKSCKSNFLEESKDQATGIRQFTLFKESIKSFQIRKKTMQIR